MVSIFAAIGVLVVSTGSVVRNQGNRSGTSRDRPRGSSGAGQDGLPGMVRSFSPWLHFHVNVGKYVACWREV